MNTVRIIFYAVVAFVCPMVMRAQQSHQQFEITGHMEGLKEGEKVYTQLDFGTYGGKFVVTDSAYVKNGEFHFVGFAEEAPRRYTLVFEKHPTKNVSLLIDNNDHIDIHSRNIELIPHDFLHNYIQIEGSKATRTFLNFWNVDPLYYQSIKNMGNYLRVMSDSIGFDPCLIAAVFATTDGIKKTLYYNYLRNLDSGYLSEAAIPYLLYMEGYLEHSSVVPEIYNEISEKSKNSYYGKILHEFTALCVGQQFPVFRLPNADGKLVNLQEIILKGKLTLVHFWAANSVQRLKYQDELRSVYKRYHNMGLNIIGISSDDSSSEYNYRKLLKEEPFPWPNLCDLKGKKGVVETVYHEYGYDDRIRNTTNVLIDDKGNIVAWDPQGVVLQWYLWKYLETNRDKPTN